MTAPPRLRPVSRLRVLASTLGLLAVLTAVAGLTQVLRHPPTIAPVAEPPDAGDPRDEIDCPPPPEEPDHGTPVQVNSNDLYDCPHVYDGRHVVYEGEVIGALLGRDDGVWVQLNDDAYAGDLGPLPAHRDFRGGNAGVGVHLPARLAGAVEWVGGPNARGDVLTVAGTYHLSDADSGEVAVIRATTGRITASGEPIIHPPLRDRQVAGIILAVAAIASLITGRLAARRRD